MTKAQYEAAVARLKERFAYQFRTPNIGYSIPLGWLQIVIRLCEGVDAALTHKERASFWWIQIKQKCGTLRTYSQGGPIAVDIIGEDGIYGFQVPSHKKKAAKVDKLTAARIRELVRAAGDTSERTCQFCGAPGSQRTDKQWIVTACDPCARARRRVSDEEEPS